MFVYSFQLIHIKITRNIIFVEMDIRISKVSD